MQQIIQTIDHSILDYIQKNLRADLLDKAMPVITYLGSGGIFWIVAAIAFLCLRKLRAIGFTVLVALILCLLIGNLGLKPLIARVRPYETLGVESLLIPKPTDYSFPSGHTMASFAAATAIFLFNKKLGIAAFALGALIAFSRLYLFVHYPTDVVGGIVIGAGIGLAAAFIVNSVRKRNAGRL